MNRPTLVINGNNFLNLESFYVEIDNVLTKGLTWNTGHNLDAFNDLLRGGFGVFEYEEPIVLIWRDSGINKINFGFQQAINRYKAMLKRCHPSSQPSVTGLLNAAEKQEGETLFEILINIIKKHEHIKLRLEYLAHVFFAGGSILSAGR